MKRPRKLSADRARRFCAALAAESEGRRSNPWWSSIDTLSRRLALPYSETAGLAVECAEAGYVTHDQSQFTKADRRGSVHPHSVTLNEAGRRLAKGQR